MPTDLDEVNEREKDIRYSSRTRIVTEALRERHNVRHVINELHKLLPPELAATPQAKRLYDHGCVTEMDIATLIYRPNEPQGAREGLRVQPRHHGGALAAGAVRRAHDAAGLALARADVEQDVGVRVFDVMHDKLVRRVRADGGRAARQRADRDARAELVMAGHQRDRYP